MRVAPPSPTATTASSLRALSDDELLRRVSDLLVRSRFAEADLVAHLGEVEQRRLYAREGSPSMFAYCTNVLHLSEHEAYLRITVARAARDHPPLLAMLADGRLHLTAIARLVPHLTAANRDSVLGRAAHRSRRQVEELVAELAPQADVPAQIRKLPEPVRAPASQACAVATESHELGPDRVGNGLSGNSLRLPTPHAETRVALVQPLSPGRYRIQFTASAAFRDKLDRLKALMRATVPDGDLAAILEAAVSEKLARLEAKRFGSAGSARSGGLLAEPWALPSSRYIPAAVRRAVYERDAGRCRFVDARGRRCRARERLEFDHVEPYGRGGGHSPRNLRLMCRAHNVHVAELAYGRVLLARFRRRGAVCPTERVRESRLRL